MGESGIAARAAAVAALVAALTIASVPAGAASQSAAALHLRTSAVPTPSASPDPAAPAPSQSPEPSEPLPPSGSPAPSPSAPSAEPSAPPVDPSPEPSSPPNPDGDADAESAPPESQAPSRPPFRAADITRVGSLEIERLSGRDQYETAIAAAQAGFPDGADVVMLASGVNFPDAIAAAPAAAALRAPLLLTGTTELREDVLQEILRLAPREVLVLGGPLALTDAIDRRLEQAGLPVIRLAGDTRYATSRLILDRAFTSSTEAVIVTGRAFPDAIVAAAAAGGRGVPVLMVDGLAPAADAATIAALRSLGVNRVSIAGGTLAISSGVAQSLSNAGFAVTRAAGDDRYATSLIINRANFSTAPRVFLASGVVFPDALAGAVLAGSVGAPLFLTSGTCVDSTIAHEMRSRLGVTRVTALGGETVVSTAAASLAECAGPSISERELTAKLQAQLASLPGQYSISVREVAGEQHRISINGGARKEPASVIKLFAAFAVLARVDDGRLSLSTPTRSGISVHECLRTMIHISDNLCHADLLALVGNSEINRQIYWGGWPNTFYVGYDGTGAYQSAKKASTDDVAEFLERLERGRMLSPASTALLLGLLDEQLWRSKIPSGIPSGVGFGNKTGQLWISTGLVEADAGIVRAPSGTYSIAVLGDRNAANWAIARLSRTVYEHLSGTEIAPASWGELNLVTKVTTNLRSGPGGSIVGTAAAGTRLVADVSNRVWYRVRLGGTWYWVHHSTVATRY